MDELSRWLVPNELWALVEPLSLPAKTRPQGGEISRVDNRAVFTPIVFVLTSGCAWRHLPPSFGLKSPLRIGGLRNGTKPACGGNCIMRCWMNWVVGD